MNLKPRISLALTILLLATTAVAADTGAPRQKYVVPPWVARSNQNAQILLEPIGRFAPEYASAIGLDGHDTEVRDLRPEVEDRDREATRQAVRELEEKLATEKDSAVHQDLEILIKAGKDHITEIDLRQKYDVPYVNLPRLVFFGMRSLLDEQVKPERRQSALLRLKRYAGMEAGYTPIAKVAEQRTLANLNNSALLPPSRAQVEKDLSTSAFFIDGIGPLFEKYKIAGYQDACTKLKEQMAAYDKFVREQVLPRARNDFRLPREEYGFRLEEVGVDIPAEQLAAMAHAGFDDIQRQMQALAPAVAKQHNLNANDYRDVIRALKKDQIVGDAILAHYQARLKDIEAIIRREHLVTLPARAATIRLATAAESAATPAPNMHPPRLLGNTGEIGEFVLPLNIPAAPGSKEATQKFDDFTFQAASWTLTAHEARPGHELQFASLVEKGVSTARAIFAFNSTNVEGWGLYSEAITFPYMPPDGQLISLQQRLLRAARAFLDPELQLGKTTPEKAKKLLMDDVVLSDAMAQQEIERYMFWAPGQATGYYYGYTRLLELRKDTEKALGPNFNRQSFHDFVLAQGLVPPPLLRTAVMTQFVPAFHAAQGH